MTRFRFRLAATLRRLARRIEPGPTTFSARTTWTNGTTPRVSFSHPKR